MTHPQNDETNTPQGGRDNPDRDNPDRGDAPARVPSDLDIDGRRDKHGGRQDDAEQPDQNPDGGQGGKDKQEWDRR